MMVSISNLNVKKSSCISFLKLLSFIPSTLGKIAQAKLQACAYSECT